MSVYLSILPTHISYIFGAFDPQQDIRQHVLIQTQTHPAWQVKEGDESHEVVRIVGVIPGAGVKLPEDQTPGELPGVDEADVDGEPPPRPPASAEVQVKVKLFHHETAAPVHHERPQGRVTAEGPVRLLHQVEYGSENHLVQKAMHPEKQEPHKTGEAVRRPPHRCALLRAGLALEVGGAGGVILQSGQPSVKHMGEIESQDVMHYQLRPRYHPHLLGQSVHVPDQDLQPDVDRRIENQMKHHRPTSKTPFL